MALSLGQHEKLIESSQVVLHDPETQELLKGFVEAPLPFYIVMESDFTVLKGEGKRRLIKGYASVEMRDKDNDLVSLIALKKAFVKLVAAGEKYANVNLEHTNITIGKILFEEITDTEGKVWKTQVDGTGLFVVCEIRSDLEVANKVWSLMLKGLLNSFSIAGRALRRSMVKKDGEFIKQIDDLELYEVTVCRRGKNVLSGFEVLKSYLDWGLIDQSTYIQKSVEMGFVPMDMIEKMTDAPLFKGLVSIVEVFDEKFEKAKWSTAYKNNLPDSAFAYIEPGGKKDAEGKTTPRSLRHLPYKDENGKVDRAHVVNALQRLTSTNIPESARSSAKKKLTSAARGIGVKVSKGLQFLVKLAGAHPLRASIEKTLLKMFPPEKWDLIDIIFSEVECEGVPLFDLVLVKSDGITLKNVVERGVDSGKNMSDPKKGEDGAQPDSVDTGKNDSPEDTEKKVLGDAGGIVGTGTKGTGEQPGSASASKEGPAILTSGVSKEDYEALLKRVENIEASHAIAKVDEVILEKQEELSRLIAKRLEDYPDAPELGKADDVGKKIPPQFEKPKDGDDDEEKKKASEDPVAHVLKLLEKGEIPDKLKAFMKPADGGDAAKSAPVDLDAIAKAAVDLLKSESPDAVKRSQSPESSQIAPGDIKKTGAVTLADVHKTGWGDLPGLVAPAEAE